jgi:hypothetical protein
VLQETPTWNTSYYGYCPIQHLLSKGPPYAIIHFRLGLCSPLYTEREAGLKRRLGVNGCFGQVPGMGKMHGSLKRLRRARHAKAELYITRTRFGGPVKDSTLMLRA